MITRDEMNGLLKEGFFQGQRFELIEGELVFDKPSSPLEAAVVGFVHCWLHDVASLKRLRVRQPVEIDSLNEPEPDLAVHDVESRALLCQRHPRPDEVRLIVEVADTSLAMDLGVKARL